MTRDGAREFFKDSGLDYSVLSSKNLDRLRRIVNKELQDSGFFRGTFCCKPSFDFQRDQSYGALYCQADYFKKREAISFNRDGFIGFSGWASTKNVQPILKGFIQWVEEHEKFKNQASNGI